MCDFVREVAGALAYSGELYFELVERDPVDEKESTPLRSIRLEMLPPGRVFAFFNRYIQIVPRYARNELGRRTATIPRENLWRLRLPRSLASPREYQRLLRQLESVSSVAPAFTMTPSLGSHVPGYTLDSYRLATDAEVENLTKQWGSIPSLQRIDGTTEYYFFERTLQFRRSVALIREQIISDLNGLLGRLRVSSRIEVSGLPSSSQIADLMNQLKVGDIDFKEAAERSRTP